MLQPILEHRHAPGSALDNAVKVQGEKEKSWQRCPPTSPHLPASTQQLQIRQNLNFDEKPDYDKCRAMFKSEMALTGGKINSTRQRWL